jgi:hypothetical protein
LTQVATVGPAALAGYPAPIVADHNPKRSPRKRRNAASAPRAVPSQRRETRAEQRARGEFERRTSQRVLGTVGKPPPSPFGGLPVSEAAILLGIVAVGVWFFLGGGAATLIVGLLVMAFGVIEVSVREHFSGYRSHTTLLAAIPAIVVAVGLVEVLNERAGDAPALIAAVPVFGLLFSPLRKRFQIARQARVARPPEPSP